MTARIYTTSMSRLFTVFALIVIATIDRCSSNVAAADLRQRLQLQEDAQIQQPAHAGAIDDVGVAWQHHQSMPAPGTPIVHAIEGRESETYEHAKTHAANALHEHLTAAAAAGEQQHESSHISTQAYDEHTEPTDAAEQHQQLSQTVYVAKAPEHHSIHLVCPAGTYIHVLDSSYGQGQGVVDPVSGVIEKGVCHAPLPIDESGCQSLERCKVTLDDAYSHPGAKDPCPYIFKRSVISYKCTNEEIPDTHIPPPLQHPHSPRVQQHEFLPPPYYKRHHLSEPTMQEYYQRFWQAQIHSSLPFTGGEACELDVHRMCGGELKNCIGDFACQNVVQCLTDSLPHASSQCRQVHPCEHDIQARCDHLQAGDNEIIESVAGTIAVHA